MRETSGLSVRNKREEIGLSQARLSEVTGIPQYLLSAFELGKGELDADQIELISQSLSGGKALARLLARKKRYREHTYRNVAHLPDRVARHSITKGNREYLELISSLQASPPAPNAPKALSLFSGIGGLSLGFKWAGFQVSGFVELDSGLRSIYAENFPHAVEIGADITQLSDAEVAASLKSTGAVDVVIGGPPCQGFSLSGKRDVADPRNGLFRHYLRFVDAHKPKVAVMENVRLLSSMRAPSGEFVKYEIERAFEARGYAVKSYSINAKDFGVPQHRERLFFIAFRKDLRGEPSFPAGDHTGEASDLFESIKSRRTFADACSDLPYLESGEEGQDPYHRAVSHPEHVIEWLWDVEEGRSAHENSNPAKRPPSGYNTTYKRQVWLEPGATVQTTFGMISGCRNVHPIATRSLTVREAARLQSIPDDFQFGSATLGKIRLGIGNAVPPLLSFKIARHLISKIF